MRNFTYQALTKDEELLTGEISAKSAAAALAELEAQGLSVLLIRQVEASETTVSPTPREPVSLSGSAGEQLLRERVAQLLDKRATLAPALTAFAEELPKGRARRDLQRLATRLHTGATVEELTLGPALANVWLPLLGNGSVIGSGHLQNVFAEAERDYANRAQLKRSLAYPTAVFVLALAVLVFLGLAVVPTFSNIFNDFNMILPDVTRLIMGLSHLLRFQPLLFVLDVAVVYAVIYFGLRLLRRRILPGRWFGEFLNGNSQQVSEMAVFVRRLTEALNAGLPLPDALQIVGKSSKHRWLRRESFRLASALVSDPSDLEQLKNSSLPATVAYALQAGPQGTPHVPLLQTLAETYFERVRNRLNWATGFLPQFALMVIGIVVGIVVLALFLPLVQLIDGLSS